MSSVKPYKVGDQFVPRYVKGDKLVITKVTPTTDNVYMYTVDTGKSIELVGHFRLERTHKLLSIL